MTDVSTVISPLGYVHTIPIFRSKRKMDGTVASGALHPLTLPDMPTQQWVEPESPEVVVNGIVRCLRINVLSQETLHTWASDYIHHEGSTRLMLAIEKERVDALRNHWSLPDDIVTIEGDAMSKSRWMHQSFVFSKPSNLTPQQQNQLLTASYWAHMSMDDTLKQRAHDILNYYRAMGYCVELRRPYRRRN